MTYAERGMLAVCLRYEARHRLRRLGLLKLLCGKRRVDDRPLTSYMAKELKKVWEEVRDLE